MLLRRSGALAALILVIAVAPAQAGSARVQLRIEGGDKTFFEGPVRTSGHDIDGHPCDGTNGGKYGSPRPTFTAALDDGPVSWDGDWNEGFEDFFIQRIGDDRNTGSKYWGYAANYKASEEGGCQDEVKDGDDVLFGFDFFSKKHLLQLTGALTAKVGEEVDLEVVDGQDGGDVSGAKVEGSGTNGADSDGGGVARVTFDSPGVKELKADRDDSIRSNELQVCVYREDPSDCRGFEPDSVSREVEGNRERGDADGDQVKEGLPGSSPGGAGGAAGNSALAALLTSIRDGALYQRGPRMIKGTIGQQGPLHQVYFRLRRVADGTCTWYSGKRKRFVGPGHCAKARFYRLGEEPEFSYSLARALPEGRYILDVKALDRSLDVGRQQVRFGVR